MRALWLAVLSCFYSVSICAAEHTLDLQRFEDRVERDFRLRRLGQLQITNIRGGVTVQGWSQDKIRVIAKRVVMAENGEQAKKLIAATDFRYREVDGDIELAAEYGRGLDIEKRLKERADSRTSMDMLVMAPANLKLRVWTTSGAVVVKGWSASVESRTSSGEINIDGVHNGGVSILCSSCSVRIKNIKGGARCMLGDGSAELYRVSGDNIYIETINGSQKLEQISGEQLFVTKGGKISGRKLNGRIEFHSDTGAVGIFDSEGTVSGRTESGDIFFEMNRWAGDDKAIVETNKGDVKAYLPVGVDLDLDARAAQKIDVAFKVAPVKGAVSSEKNLRGRIGMGGEQLSLISREGNVRVFKGSR